MGVLALSLGIAIQNFPEGAIISMPLRAEGMSKGKAFFYGVLMIAGNLFFLPLFFFYWVFMTVLMKCTEEWWLKRLYGREYKEYYQKVNRCIPWLTKNGR